MNFWWYFILFFFPLTGGILALLIQQTKTQHLKLFLAFSGAFLFAITVLELIPEVYGFDPEMAGFLVLLGFFFQIAIDHFSKGIEHGHLHFHPRQNSFPFPVFFALSAHAILEGMSLGSGVLEESTQESLIFGIGLHEIPAAFALATLFKLAQLKKRAIYFYISIYAMMVPAGCLMGHLLLEGQLISEAFRFGLMAVVIGVFLHISTTILFENSDDHSFSRYKLMAVILGIGVALAAGH